MNEHSSTSREKLDVDPAVDTTLPLAGMRVVEIGHFIAGPAAGMRLADMGADVVKIEPPGGDSARFLGGGRDGDAMFQTFNRNKRSIQLDLRHDPDVATARELMLAADVVVTNIALASLARRGLGPDEIRAVNPEVVYASVCGFPDEDSPVRRKGFDSIAQAESGMMSINGERGGGPLKVGFTLVDVAAGDSLAQGVLAALLRRTRTGTGAEVKVSLFATALHLQEQNFGLYLLTGDVPGRIGNVQPLVAPASEVIEVKDGHIMLSAYVESHWRTLCDVLEMPEAAQDERFATNADRIANRADLQELLANGLTDKTIDEALELLESAGLAVGGVRSYDQVVNGPFAGHVLQDVPKATGGTFGALVSPVTVSDEPPAEHRAPPLLDQDAEEILAELTQRRSSAHRGPNGTTSPRADASELPISGGPS